MISFRMLDELAIIRRLKLKLEHLFRRGGSSSFVVAGHDSPHRAPLMFLHNMAVGSSQAVQDIREKTVFRDSAYSTHVRSRHSPGDSAPFDNGRMSRQCE